MKNILSRLRGVLGIGAVWAGLGSVIGSVGGVIGGLLGAAPLGEAIVVGAVGIGSLGFMLGTAFSLALTLAERSRTLRDLTPKRAALWGGAAGALLPVIFFVASSGSIVGARLSIVESLLAVLMASTVYGSLSAGLAAGTIAVAKRDNLLPGPDESTQLEDSASEPGEGPSSLPGVSGNPGR